MVSYGNQGYRDRVKCHLVSKAKFVRCLAVQVMIALLSLLCSFLRTTDSIVAMVWAGDGGG